MKKLLTLALACGALGLQAQYRGRSGIRYQNDGSTFTVRRTNDWSPNRTDGRCRIRVRIDDDSDVELRGEQIRIRVLRGGPGRDEGSECNAPLPTAGNFRNFRFRGVDGRGNPRLVQEPGSRNFYTAVVNIQDSKGGDEGYTFDLMWESDGSYSGGYSQDRPSNRPWPANGGGSGIFPGQPIELSDMNLSLSGDGTLDDGSGRHGLRTVAVRVQRGSCRVTMVTDRRERFELNGNTSRDSTRCNLNSSNRGRTDASALFLMDGNRIAGVDVDGRVNGRNFTANFRGR